MDYDLWRRGRWESFEDFIAEKLEAKILAMALPAKTQAGFLNLNKMIFYTHTVWFDAGRNFHFSTIEGCRDGIRNLEDHGLLRASVWELELFLRQAEAEGRELNEEKKGEVELAFDWTAESFERYKQRYEKVTVSNSPYGRQVETTKVVRDHVWDVLVPLLEEKIKMLPQWEKEFQDKINAEEEDMRRGISREEEGACCCRCRNVCEDNKGKGMRFLADLLISISLGLLLYMFFSMAGEFVFPMTIFTLIVMAMPFMHFSPR